MGRLIPLTGPGQIKLGDAFVFIAGGIEYIERAVIVLNPGTDREEIIWNKRENKYFITLNVLDDGKYQSPYLTKVRIQEPRANVRKEAVQTAVMCARVVLDGDGSVNAWRAEKGLDPLVPAAPDSQDGGEDA